MILTQTCRRASAPLGWGSPAVYWSIGMPRLCYAGFLLLFPFGLPGQTTDGLISGRVTDSQTGAAVAGAAVSCSNPATHTTAVARADSAGYFALPLLPPGIYPVRSSADTYHAQEVPALTLAVL